RRSILNSFANTGPNAPFSSQAASRLGTSATTSKLFRPQALMFQAELNRVQALKTKPPCAHSFTNCEESRNEFPCSVAFASRFARALRPLRRTLCPRHPDGTAGGTRSRVQIRQCRQKFSKGTRGTLKGLC